MTIKLEATTLKYGMTDDSGYGFTIVAERDEEFRAWSARVEMRTDGSKTAEGAIMHLEHAAKAFLRQIAKTGWEK